LPGGTQPPGCPLNPAGTTGDNGNVIGYTYTDGVNSSLSHTALYVYDSLNRLACAQATGNSTYNQSFAFDAYGNLSCTPSSPGCVNLTYNTATNHIAGYTYDAAGNVTNDGTNTYQWDAEGHLIAVINGARVAISTNTYNALGQRVRDVTQTNTTDEAYGAGGSLLWRYTGNPNDPNQRAFVPSGGRILAEYYTGGTLFDHPDQLGSITSSTSANGSPCQERLFYPFGELWTGAGNCGMHQTFAQLPDYDAETDQYNTLFRHYTPNGRWMRPDPLAGDVTNPQSLNRYAYVRNNPTTLTDPSGLENQPTSPTANGNSCVMSFGPGPCGQPPTQATETGANTEDPSQGDPTITLGNVNVAYQFFAVEQFGNGQMGAYIDANPAEGSCDGCRWTQTTSRTGEAAHDERTDGNTGTPLYPGGYHEGGSDGANLHDEPSSNKAGSFTAVSSLVEVKGKTITIKGSMTWVIAWTRRERSLDRSRTPLHRRSKHVLLTRCGVTTRVGLSPSLRKRWLRST